MNHYIERYIADVTRRLPENQREDVSLELQSLIEDMLEETDDVERVLKTLGHPRTLASKYREKPRYLISPDYFDHYVDTLKLVLRIVLIVSSVIAGIVVLSDVISSPINTMDLSGLIRFIVSLIVTNISMMLSMLVTAVVGVTLVFALIEYTGSDIDGKEWSVDDLPPLEKQNLKKISKGEVVTEIVMSLFFIGVLLAMVLNNMNIPVYIEGTLETQVFNLDVLRQYTLLITIAASLDIMSSVIKLAMSRYNTAVAFTTLISNTIGIAVAGIVLLHPNLFTPEFTTFMAGILPNQEITLTLRITFGIICIISIYDIASAFYYAMKNKTLA